ncbi:MAG: hypothetical protein AAGF99_00995 [Bacteroidota bacterium]
MPNPNPSKARQSKKRKRIRRRGSLDDALLVQWQAITTAKEVLLGSAADDATALRAVHAITQATTAYAKLLEVGELEAEVATLKDRVNELLAERGMRRVA